MNESEPELNKPQLEEAVSKPSKSSKKKTFKKVKSPKKLFKFKAFLAVMVAFLVVAPSAYFYQRSQVAENKLKNPTEANKQIVDELEKKVGKHYLLPSDEQPTLVTVTDVEKVRGQQFFDKAENGDKALVYTQARKAVLYRPSQDIVVEVAPLNVDSATPIQEKSQ